MNESRAAIRYAKATLDLATEKKAAGKVESDMRQIASVINENAELRNVLASPVVNSKDKKGALTQIFKGSHQITLGLIGTLTDNKRIGMLNEVALKYIILHEKMKGEDVAFVTSAVPLTEALENKILKYVNDLTGNKVTIENKIDENILGGFILRVGDLQYDASVANKLNGLKREFTNSL
ncbi:MAG: ATP synthase F1 subunit delta [Croceitalea sp.]|nr:ATP synthase F1 subunit delta [Croceitalea sp.]